MQQKSTKADADFKKKTKIESQINSFESYFPNEKEPHLPQCETINRPLAEVHAILQDVGNFPKFFEHLEKIVMSGASQATWNFSSDPEAILAMELSVDDKNHSLLWKSADKAGFPYKVAIQLRPAQAGRGTVVQMKVAYETTSGAIAGALEKLLEWMRPSSREKICNALRPTAKPGTSLQLKGSPMVRPKSHHQQNTN